ncbi:MAG: CRISPR-associated exonuclease Cas4 [Verrucomicrobiales bacterium]|jgi:CRISPR-associated exonuclease Cas4
MEVLLPLSALQHLLFCERQCALIHIEQVWAENRFTTEGNILHERAHDGPDEARPGVRIRRGLPIRSVALGVLGIADIVEFHEDGTVLPVEYKRGKPKSHSADEVQICAQAICLEEMLGTSIPSGFLYYGKNRRRHEVEFNETLRALTVEAARRLHEMIGSHVTPPAIKEKKCESCSLIELCMPDALRLKRGAAAWFAENLNRSTDFADDADS